MNMVQVLQKIRNLIENEHCWTKDYLAINDEKDHVEPTDDDACAWCFLGAIDYVVFYEYLSRQKFIDINFLLNSIVQENGFTDITVFNDHSTTKHKDVLAVIDKGIEQSQSGQHV